VITSEDDPFVPAAPFHDPRLAGNPYVTLCACTHGGHCGFVGPASGEDDGYWAEDRVAAFIEQCASASISARPNSGPLPSSSCLK
jgi:predicted alpha/beta-fold hydrolase